jgi:hypothetical protein
MSHCNSNISIVILNALLSYGEKVKTIDTSLPKSFIRSSIQLSLPTPSVTLEAALSGPHISLNPAQQQKNYIPFHKPCSFVFFFFFFSNFHNLFLFIHNIFNLYHSKIPQNLKNQLVILI